MIKHDSTIDEQELHKFAQHADHWWDKEGPLKTLHDINPTRLDFIKNHASLEGARVLDVGCGGGILCEALARCGADVTGIDAEADAIKSASEHARQQNLSIHYKATPIEEFEAERFDIITCMEMLEHVQRPEQVIQHCKRLLKPGGILFLSTISRTLKAYASAIIVAEYLLNLLPKQTHDYDKFIKPSELASMARAYGFTLVDLNGLNFNPISRIATLNNDVSINYLMVLRGNV
ncbi:bifunctional 2-polyprenyl-6-hydroxyphenol methylase/3-demethylubiquinol 3-O-methyltransferase UbiG [uncultured Legionella sp.]|uniref:bifunctional 2-polyprenyl-6-hydroxyphenol methylase/3-demethylubiquinol 3-O-methyltransferase UbiG n=1 Tax=uncultured Legionella sp. TaxID=210934 RepID=UPI00260C9471|nr:bifunctional 2-polyprenyl-6-hydroxyphenol methylase/3-demethylubiquinol 3-O-methyltransferase UbiG [uncultured Legionella sp.]